MVDELKNQVHRDKKHQISIEYSSFDNWKTRTKNSKINGLLLTNSSFTGEAPFFGLDLNDEILVKTSNKITEDFKNLYSLKRSKFVRDFGMNGIKHSGEIRSANSISIIPYIITFVVTYLNFNYEYQQASLLTVCIIGIIVFAVYSFSSLIFVVPALKNYFFKNSVKIVQDFADEKDIYDKLLKADMLKTLTPFVIFVVGLITIIKGVPEIIKLFH